MATTLTLPGLTEGFTLQVDSAFGDRYLTLFKGTEPVASWSWVTGKITADPVFAKFECDRQTLDTILRFVEVDARYEWAENAHCSATDGDSSRALCGSASASPRPSDPNPIVRFVFEFEAMPVESTCWECRAIDA